MEITDDHIKVALARRLGEGRGRAGARVGVEETTVRYWESTAWWADVEAKAAKLHDAKILGKARRVVENILDRALEPECPTSVLNQAAALSRWYIETRDPDFRSEGASPSTKALEKLSRALDSFTEAELRALADEPTILGFPDDTRTDQTGSPQEVSASKAPIVHNVLQSEVPPSVVS